MTQNFIEILNSSKEFDEAIKESSNWSVYQTWAWGDIRKILGFVPYRYHIRDLKAELSGIALQEMTLGLGLKFLLAQGLPSWQNISEGKLRYLAEILYEIGKKRNAIFVALEPYISPQPQFNIINIYNYFSKVGFKKAVFYRRPSETLLIDLASDENDNFSGMKPSHRRDIRRAERRGVKIRQGNLEDADYFYNFYKMLPKSDYHHPHKYWKSLFKELIDNGYADCLVGMRGEDIESVGIFLRHAKIYQYYYMASNKGSNYGASYSVMWEAIKRAKGLGYDFFEVTYVAENPGLKHWKSGFGGIIVNYLGPYELVISPAKYYLFLMLLRIFGIINKGFLSKIRMSILKKGKSKIGKNLN
ncbi:MAG: lipid II:glycine glycyltransferase FemX [Desulfobaccales bacterium]